MSKRHFTYKKVVKKSAALEQGDVIERTEEITEILKAVHPYYLQDNYLKFIILTQSCDLAIRKNSHKAKYITIAAIRPLSLVRERFLNDDRSELERKADIAGERIKGKLKSFLVRLFNNNIPEYFFLYKDSISGIDENMVAFLRLSIALKSDLHYKALQKARISTLSPEFRAQLGWNVGNIYSRVGTPDWDDVYSKEKYEEAINAELMSQTEWINDDIIKAILNKYEERSSRMSSEEIRRIIDNANISISYEDNITAITNELKRRDLIDDVSMTNIRQAMQTSTIIKNSLKGKKMLNVYS